LRRSVFVISLLAAAFLFLGGATWIAEYRVAAGLREAGVGDKTSGCMARRMVKRLTYVQLWKLQSFEGEKHGLGDYVAAVKRVGDGKVITVTASSAALCASGLAR
jgi:hypothetical protein